MQSFQPQGGLQRGRGVAGPQWDPQGVIQSLGPHLHLPFRPALPCNPPPEPTSKPKLLFEHTQRHHSLPSGIHTCAPSVNVEVSAPLQAL